MEQGMSMIQVKVSGFSGGSRGDEVVITTASWKEDSMQMTCKESCEVVTPKPGTSFQAAVLQHGCTPNLAFWVFSRVTSYLNKMKKCLANYNSLRGSSS